MKRFASNRLYVVHLDVMLRNQVVEVEEYSGRVVSYYPFTEEISFTEWLGGLIVVSGIEPSLSDKEDCFRLYVDENKKIRSTLSHNIDNAPLKAYHVTNFNVAMMCFSDDSRIVPLL